MSNYKADTTLNEKDSLQDMLILEKDLVKIYATAIAEGASNGFRTVIKQNLDQATHAQLDVFMNMCERDYYRVEAAPEEELKAQREKFAPVKSQLS